MTIREAAQRISKSESALRRAIKSKRLKAELIDGRYDITDEALKAYAPDKQMIGAPMLDTAELERLRVENEELKRELEEIRSQVKKKDDLIADAQKAAEEANKRHDIVVMQMPKLIEYHQQPFWRRLFSRKALPPPVDETIMDMETSEQKETSGE